MNVLNEIKTCGIVPVIVVDDYKKSIPLAEALLDGGIKIMEITFRTDGAEKAIKIISDNMPEMIVGAGTILSIGDLERAYNAGAKFIVSPGLDENVVKKSKELGIPIVPGAVTPTEITKAIQLGCEVVKFFPAENYGGLKTIKSLSSPFSKIKFIPTGGINLDNLEEYINFDKIIAVGGSWVCPSDLIKNSDFNKITQISKETMNVIKRNRL